MTNAQHLNEYFKSFQPAVTDILPSIAQHLDIIIPRANRWELDGVPLTGNVSVAHPEVALQNDSLKVSWKSYASKGNVKIWIAASNNFKEGGEDKYELLGETSVVDEHFAVPFKNKNAALYKLVIEGEYNAVNKWIPK